MKKLTSAILLVGAALLLTSCSVFESDPCDGDWEFTQETTSGNQVSVTIYVFESEIYSFRGTAYDPEAEEVLLSVGLYGNGVPLTPLYYNEENDGYWFEYPEGTGASAGVDSFTGTLWPDTGAASCGFSSYGAAGGYSLEVDSGAFTPSK